LLKDNDRLRRRLVQVESELARALEQEPSASTLQELVEKLHTLEGERAALLERFAETEALGERFAERYHEIEQENSNLASLYVAQSQLHSSLAVGDVLQVIIEIVLNFVGGKQFVIYMADHSGTQRALAVHALDIETIPPVERGRGVIGEVGLSGRTHAGEGPVPKGLVAGRDDPFVCFPLRGDGTIMGTLAIWGFLLQKETLVDVDQQIFDLLSSSGGRALEAARLATRIRRQEGARLEGTYEAYAELLE
jgi:nitrate/nitrite-specific signal transduction histidine kinase